MGDLSANFDLGGIANNSDAASSALVLAAAASDLASSALVAAQSAVSGTSGLQIGALAATGAAVPTQRMAASRFKAYSSGTITSLGVFPYLVTATKHIVLGIYSDNSNYPGSLLGQTDAYAFVATDLRTPIHLALQSPVSLTANTQYWIAFMCEDTKPNLYAVIPVLNAGGQYKTIAYSDTFPDPFPAGGSNDYLWSVWGM
jgi:hypothetical protein